MVTARMLQLVVALEVFLLLSLFVIDSTALLSPNNSNLAQRCTTRTFSASSSIMNRKMTALESSSSNNDMGIETPPNNNDNMKGAVQPSNCAAPHPNSLLPGDPSLHIVTNVDLGDNKLDIMKACSKIVCAATGKPESYVAVSITDKASVIFGGTDDPAALGTLYSIGAIAVESNGKITNDVTDIMEPYGVDPKRIYINFFDMPRANVGWDRKTFAG